MAINHAVYAEKIVRSFLKHQLSPYPFSDTVRRTPPLSNVCNSRDESSRELWAQN